MYVCMYALYIYVLNLKGIEFFTDMSGHIIIHIYIVLKRVETCVRELRAFPVNLRSARLSAGEKILRVRWTNAFRCVTGKCA